MRHWGNMGHMRHMVKKAGQFGDPEISLGWRHSGQGPAKKEPTRAGARHIEDGVPHNAMTFWLRLMMSAFLLASSGSRSTGSAFSCPLPHGEHGAEA